MDIKALMIDALENLVDEDLKKFKWQLWNGVEKDIDPIPRAKLQKADRSDVVDYMVDKYSDEAGKITVQALRKINQNHCAKILESKLQKVQPPEQVDRRNASVSVEDQPIQSDWKRPHSITQSSQEFKRTTLRDKKDDVYIPKDKSQRKRSAPLIPNKRFKHSKHLKHRDGAAKDEENMAENSFRGRRNKRKAREFEGEHVSIQNLKKRDEIRGKQQLKNYLSKDITAYPTPVEFHITELTHVTDKTSLQKIWKSEGFMRFDQDLLSWWSLKINEADIRAAEERFLESSFPDISKEEIAAQQPFLSEFATSPAFINETSRYGNFRFTFPLTKLIEAYKKQMCEDEESVLRVYETKLFKQKIEYVVLVHSPQFNEKFSKYPLLASSKLLSYEGNQIIWKAQAICETHKCQLVINGNQASFRKLKPNKQEFYVWDQLSLAFHVNGVLTFPRRKLKASLSCCAIDQKVKLSNIENCSSPDKFLKSLL